MVDTLVFDLDDTLLTNPMDTFLPAYFKALTVHLKDHVPSDRLVPELLRATQTMMANRDPQRSNMEVFGAAFYPALGLDEGAMAPILAQFYEEAFPALRAYTGVVPEARPLLEAAHGRGYGLVIATNPVFPRRAIEQRLDWAGVGDLPYLYVTSYETMHYTKPHPEYYLEIVSHIGREPGRCVMVGNDFAQDILPAKAVGMRTFLVAAGTVLPPASGPDVGIMEVSGEEAVGAGADYEGSLADLWALIEAGRLGED
jgi:FMN phosphatase YigB (HAD superfamily)